MARLISRVRAILFAAVAAALVLPGGAVRAAPLRSHGEIPLGDYTIAIEGAVDRQPFERVGLLHVLPTMARTGTTNGVNPVDVCLGSGSPFISPERGAIWLVTNTDCLRAARAQQLDMAAVDWQDARHRLTVEIDGSLSAVGVNGFNMNVGLTANVFQIFAGTMTIAFDDTGDEVSGTIEIWGTGAIFHSEVPYEATFTGERDTDGGGSSVDPGDDGGISADTGDDEPRSDEEATDDADVDADVVGVDGNRYVSPTYGWSISWDPDLWEVLLESSEDGTDRFRLVGPDGRRPVYFTAFPSDGDALACVERQVAKLDTTEDIVEYEIVEQPQGDDLQAVALSLQTNLNDDGEPETFVEYDACLQLVPGEAVLRILHISQADRFEAQFPLVIDLLEELELPSN